MTKKLLAITAISLLCSQASADDQGLNARDTAGIWTGVASGTFQGQFYAAVTTVAIARDGLSAVVQSDSTIGPTTSSCTLTSFSALGTALVHCTFTAGPAIGVQFDVHYTLTDHQQRLQLWIANPAMAVTADLARP